ncbi:MAG: ATP-grasp domain-containing protein, partial [Planctomycetes bacterium]|nr:ATP-grasp domain-containing protein [Planctomycetota bacterium]
MFKKILIANRGEIAVRIAQTVQELGITAVGVFSEPDRRAVHVSSMDEAYALEGSTSAESYLRIEKIIDIARKHGVDAIHPGFGFLSENEDFAQACADARITFIGPRPDVIRDMGDKIIAKEKFKAAGVPVVPGWSGEGNVSLDELKKIAAGVGYPVLIKAAAGGGGKGMRVVKAESDLQGALEAAQREANAAFGDARVFIEKYITRPRHIEFQIFGDSHGNVVHLFERECSIQRRHQKIVEESPSTALSDELRAKMGEAAVRAAKAIGYTNAGTVEFIVDESGSFYFLEVNTRLQVEHPVTEMVVGRDLVRAQIAVAAGEKLPFEQEQLRQTGHALEVRIYAEDASRNFMPSTGRIE